ncbi:hypothetical protein pb186bvf_008170 [Paramecium bursaria]
MIINKIRFGVSAVRILNKFTEDFYAANFTKAFETLGFPQSQINIGKKQINLIGVPHKHVGDQYLDDLTDIILKNNESAFMVQVDPSPYLYHKRQLQKQYHKNIDPIPNQGIFNQLPLIPLDLQELEVDFNLFDALHFIRENKELNTEQKQNVLKILENKQTGYFQGFFSSLNDKKNKTFTEELEKQCDQVQQQFGDLLQNTVLYNNQSQMLDYSKLTMFQGLYMALLKGSKVFLNDLSQIYLRIYSGRTLSLEQAQDQFQNICAEAIQQDNIPVHVYFRFQNAAWLQMATEYFLVYNVNKFVEQEDEDQLTGILNLNQIVLVDQLHYDPLKIIFEAQNGKIIKEVQQSYFQEFSFPQSEFKESDEQLIEKHAIFDSLQVKLWNEPCINNPFPYISVDYTQLSPVEQKELQQLYLKYSTKYETVVQKANQKYEQSK